MKRPKVKKEYRFEYGFPFWVKLPQDFIGWICLIDKDIPKHSYVYIKNRYPHRIDGPAVIEFSTKHRNWMGKQFWLNNQNYEEQDYWNHELVVNHKINKILEFCNNSI